MRHTFILLSLLLLANCQSTTYPSETLEGKARTHAYLLCGSMTNDCYQSSYASFYQNEIQGGGVSETNGDGPFYEAPRTEQKTSGAPAVDMLRELSLMHAHCMGRAYGAHTSDVTYVPKCERDPTLAILKKYRVPNLDIQQYQLDARIALYEQRQQHKITDAQLQANLSELAMKVKSMENSRLNDEIQAAASDQPPIIIQQPAVSQPDMIMSQPAYPVHCDSSVDKAGNGSMNCY